MGIQSIQEQGSVIVPDEFVMGSWWGRPLKWRVLRLEGSRALVTTTRVLDAMAYHSASQPAEWETSNVRTWMNGEFFQDAFTDEDRAAIVAQEVQTPGNDEYEARGCATTTDKVFSLSVQEVGGLFASDDARNVEGDNPCWWLRSPGGADGFEALRPMPPCEYRMLRAADAVDLTTQDGRTQYAIACCNILRKVKNPVELENYLDKLIVQTGFAREVLMRQIGVEALAAEQKRSASVDRPLRREARRELPEHVKAQQMLVNLMAAGRIERALSMDTAFITEPYRTIARLLAEGQKPAAVIEQLDENVRDEAVCAHAAIHVQKGQLSLACGNARLLDFKQKSARRYEAEVQRVCAKIQP